MEHTNPAITMERDELDAEWERLTANPVGLERPVVVFGGWHALPSMADRALSRLCDATSQDEDDFLNVSFPLTISIGAAADHAVRRVDRRWPSDSDTETVEVDVVAVSMGGLVAREAALREPIRGGPRKRLKIRRLYTLATPHRGAGLARYIYIDPASRDMRPGSKYLQELDTREIGYEIVPYAHLNDTWVGATRAAPPGRHALWTRGTLLISHFTVTINRLVLADIARRLRGEEPIMVEGAAPPCD